MVVVITGSTYLERGVPVTVAAAWNAKRNPELPRLRELLPLVVTRPSGPRNVLIERADGTVTVRGFRGLRKPPDAP